MDKKILKELESLNRGLEVAIVLLAKLTVVDDKKTLRQQIRELDATGLGIPDIAKILSKKPGHISKELTYIRKGL